MLERARKYWRRPGNSGEGQEALERVRKYWGGPGNTVERREAPRRAADKPGRRKLIITNRKGIMVGKSIKEYMMEQPATMRKVSTFSPAEAKRVLSVAGRKFERIILVGSGTSLNACLAAAYMFEYYCNAEVKCCTPFDFLHYFPAGRLDSKTLVMGVSQTARSTGTIDSVKKARQCGAQTIFVTAEPENEGAGSAVCILDTFTGEELVGAKTKGFTSTMAALFYLAAELGGQSLQMEPTAVFMEEVLRRTGESIVSMTESFKDVPSLTILGYGPGMAAVKEGGLKILETVRIPVETYDVEEFMHGPYHCLEKDSYYIFLAPEGAGQERAGRLIQFVEEITNHTLVIGNDSFMRGRAGNRSLSLPDGIDEKLAPCGYVIPLQWLALDITIARGRRPEVSRYPDFHKRLGSKFMPKINYYTGL